METTLDESSGHSSVKDLDFRFYVLALLLELDIAFELLEGNDFIHELNTMPLIESCSPDGKFLVSVGSGPGRIWNVASSKSIASLPKENVLLLL